MVGATDSPAPATSARRGSAARPAVVAVATLGVHTIHQALPGQWFDAVDVALRLAPAEPGGDERLALFGVRTAGYVAAHDAGAVEDWGGYRPMAVTLDLGTVGHWSFNDVLWLGPAAHPCLAWSNAVALSERAVTTLLTGPGAEPLLAGSGGRGLPTPSEAGVELPGPLPWRSLAALGGRA